MTEAQFWQNATDILNVYRGRFNHIVLTDDEKTADVGAFLTDMDALATRWYDRNIPTSELSSNRRRNDEY